MELGKVTLRSGDWDVRVEEHEEFGGLVVTFRRPGRPEAFMARLLPPEGAPPGDALLEWARDADVRWWTAPDGRRWMVRLDHGPRPGVLSFELQELNQWIQSVPAPEGTRLGDITDEELERLWQQVAKP